MAMDLSQNRPGPRNVQFLDRLASSGRRAVNNYTFRDESYHVWILQNVVTTRESGNSAFPQTVPCVPRDMPLFTPKRPEGTGRSNKYTFRLKGQALFGLNIQNLCAPMQHKHCNIPGGRGEAPTQADR